MRKNAEVAKIHLEVCYQHIRDTKKEIVSLLRRAFPIGTQVSWMHGKNRLTGIVIDHHDMFDQLKVRGISKAEYWVDARKLV